MSITSVRRVFLAILSLTFLLPAGAAGEDQYVGAVYPHPHVINAESNTDIVVWFENALDPGTVDSETFRVWGRWSGPMSGTFTFENFDKKLIFTPDEPFFAGEYITVSVTKGVLSINAEPLPTGYQWNFWIKTAPGTLDLDLFDQTTTRMEGEGWIQSYGAYAGDLNNDGYSDLSLPNERSDDVRVFLNDGAGGYSSFTPYSVPNGENPSTNEGADFDHDGEIDLAIGNALGTYMSVLFGDGTGVYNSGDSYYSGNGVRGITVLDLDGDGWDDVVTANRISSNVALFLNDGDGTFAPGSTMEGGGLNEFAAAAGDANGDGIMDVFIGCYGSETICTLLGDGNGGLTYHSSASSGGATWMIAVGDVNNDGIIDVVSANSDDDNVGVLVGDGTGALANATTYPGGDFPLAIDLGDIDGDNDLDLVASCYTSEEWLLYENVGGTYVNPRSFPAPNAGSCAILHDRDNDGDMDMSTIDELDDILFLWENDPTPTAAGAAAGRTVLLQNRPNPFNPTTTVPFELERAGHVRVTVYAVDGTLVRKLADREFDAGRHAVRWAGRDHTGAAVGSGVYFYRLEALGRVETRKMVLLK